MRKYKYMPEDFADTNGLDEDLATFYNLLEQYQNDQSSATRGLLRNQYETVFYSLKHHVLENFIDEQIWEDVNSYLGGFFDD